ncbi:MAG: ABC transporter substrate-binding protein [Eubacteriaceae bacterium]|nr:ABC transporter substrate-binding protein [Eubacteriaceae bacterium]
MKYSKFTAAVLAVLLMVTMTACRPEKQPTGAITVTDMTGRTVKLDKPAEKVIPLSAATGDILYALGCLDNCVGRGELCDYPAEILLLPKVNSGSDTNVEEIIALGPEVVFMSTMAQTTEQMDALEAAGIKVVVTDAQSIDGIYDEIRLIGKVMGKDEEAEKVVSDMKSILADLESNATGDGTKTVYFEVSPLKYGLWTAGDGTFMNELAKMLKLKNIFEDVNKWAQVSEEQVIERNPDIIVILSTPGEDPGEYFVEVLSRKGWENVTAIKNGSVLMDTDSSLTRPSQRLTEGARMLYEFVYGN